MRRRVLAAVLLAAAACSTDPSLADGVTDDFVTDGKADTGGIVEGSPEALAVLEIANTFSESQLRDEVELAERTRNNILAFRAGDDETAGTSDDGRFRTLAELDAVPYVGPIAFGKLLDFARANDLVGDVVATPVDAFADDPCPGAAMSSSEAQAALGSLGAYQIVLRQRQCTEDELDSNRLSCGDWRPLGLDWLSWAANASGIIKLAAQEAEPSLIQLQLLNETCGHTSPHRFIGAQCNGVGVPAVSCYAYTGCRDPLTLFGVNVGFTGKLTAHCLSLKSDVHTSEHDWDPLSRRYRRSQVQLGIRSTW